MASVFLSYDRDDTERARPIAEALESAGHEVWWDLHVRGGAQFSKVIEDALNASQVVVVLWSTHSVNSTWVRDEAAAGRDSGRLVPVTLDGTKAPLGFRQFQTIDLSVRKGRSKSAELKNLLADIQAVANAPNAAPMGPQRPISAKRVFRLEWRIAAAVVAIVGIIAALAIWRPWAGREQVPRVVVEAAANDRYSQALARDLVVKLGSLQSIHSAPMRLINRSDSSGDRPDLVLEVGRLADSSAVTANVALMTARDRGILWSKEFEQPSRNLADLKQQIAYTAARVLGCATDGLRAPGKPLREEPLKLYLNACGQLAEVTDEAPAVVPALLQVIRQAPRFKAAWKLLLLTEADMVDPARQEGNADPALRRTLADHIAAARKLDPQMAEATIAQIALLPLTDFVKRMQLIDQAKRNSPDNPVVLQIRSQMLRTVGRMREAIEDSSRAVDLNPLSPLLHAGYFNALIYAGGLESAPQELRRVEQLWPGSSTLRDMQRRYHLRFGDPKIARELLTEDAYQGDELYLTARAQPTPENIDRFVAYALGLGRTQAARLVWLMQGLGQFHREDQLFQVMMTWPRPQDFAALEDAWFRPQLKAFREDARFMRVAARSPLIKYWQTTGNWPDFCSDPGFPYNCKAEAANVTA